MRLRRDILTDNARKPIQRMMRVVTSCQRLSDEEEFRLGLEYATATPERKREIERILLESNMRFVVTVAKQYQLKREDLEDLVQCGAMGLLQAIRMWDPTRGIKLISYAVHRIRREVYEYTKKEYTKHTVPYHFKYIRDISQHYDELVYNYGGITPEALMQCLGYDENTARRAIAAYMGQHTISLSELDEQDYWREALLEDKSYMPDNIVERKERYELLYAALDKLDPKERCVVKKFYGLESGPQSLTDIAEDMGIGVYVVKRILRNAHRKLQCILKDYYGTEAA
jgi:RNA polymerase sigma factor (sigma-70 family)